MSSLQVIINPAYHLEATAFNFNIQPSYSIQNNVLARIAALVAPLFYAYQIGLHLILAALTAVPYLICMTDGMACKNMLLSVLYSVQNLVSATLEIPHKLITGPSNVPNYCGNKDRYQMNHLGEKPIFVDMKIAKESLQPIKPLTANDLPDGHTKNELLRRQALEPFI